MNPKFELIRSAAGLRIWYCSPSKFLCDFPFVPMDRSVEETEAEAQMVLALLNANAAAADSANANG